MGNSENIEDKIEANLDELADLALVYKKQKDVGHNPVATRCAMLRQVGKIYVLYTGPKPPLKQADA